MQRLAQVILLMRATPQRFTLARFAQMNWLLTRTLGHRAPTTVAYPAEIAADIADHHAGIRALVLIAHSVRLCITLYGCTTRSYNRCKRQPAMRL
jgi:hypothetical protein